MPSVSLEQLNTWSPFGGCLEKIKRCGLVGGSMLQGVSFETSKDLRHFELALCASSLWFDVSS